MALTKVSTGVVDMSQDTGGLVIAKGTTAQQPTCDASILGSIRENTTENKVEVCTSTGWQFLEEAGTTFIPLIVDYLVVGGGGGGGNYYYGGGGGGGGFRTSFGTGNVNGGLTPVESSLQGAANVNYTVTVGTAGSGGSNSGAASSLVLTSTITSIGGGAGGTEGTGFPGGSGGGGANYPINYNGGAANTSPVQGFSGGNAVNSTYNAGAGGGGAGEIGTGGAATAALGGKGGDGIESLITGTAVYYAGGGGGGLNRNTTFFTPQGGLGGGGNGAGSTSVAVSGTDGLGGGGGGGSHASFGTGNGASGGSGVVILRYPSNYDINFQTGVGFISSTATLSATSERVTTITAGSGTITFV